MYRSSIFISFFFQFQVWDATAADPKLLVYLKAYRNTVPVPRHWSQKRKFLQVCDFQVSTHLFGLNIWVLIFGEISQYTYISCLHSLLSESLMVWGCGSEMSITPYGFTPLIQIPNSCRDGCNYWGGWACWCNT